MRTHIFIAAVAVLAATAAHAGPRSLSGAQTNPIEAPAPKIQVLEAPKPVEVPKLAEPAAPEAPAPAPVTAAPAPAPAPVTETAATVKPAEAAPAETKPAYTTASVPTGKRKQAQRSQARRQAGVEQRMSREFRAIEPYIGIGIGIALSAASSYYW